MVEAAEWYERQASVDRALDFLDRAEATIREIADYPFRSAERAVGNRRRAKVDGLPQPGQDRGVAEFRIDILKSLARQMAFAPRGKRLAQISAAEDLLLRVDADRGYPPEFVVHAVTGYRPKPQADGGDAAELLAGVALQHDLGLLLDQVSDPIDLSVAEAGEPVLTIEDVCRRFGVTSKTIQRWRRKGLPARRFVFDDAKKRVGFRLSCVERFVARQEGAAERPAGVEPMTAGQQAECVRRGRQLLAGGHDRNEIVRRLARRLGRSRLAVLHTLEHHDRTAVEPILPDAAEPPSEAQAAAVNRLSDARRGLAAAARRSGVSRFAAYRAVMERRAERLATAGVKFHDDPLFHRPGGGDDLAEREIDALVRSAESGLPEVAAAGDAGRGVPRGLPPYLAELYRTPLLTPALERALFLRFNYHKSRFAALREQIDPHLCRRRDLERLERHLDLARRAKNRILTANLRLVVSVARKHLRPGLDLMELVSDGNIVLMRAVEGFDVGRGFRFSTYATLALMKGFARSVPQMQAVRPAGGRSADELGRRDAGFGRLRDRDEIAHLLARLDECERRVVAAQYGLEESTAADDREATLAGIGRALGLTKHRVRQIEETAIEKLRRAAAVAGGRD